MVMLFAVANAARGQRTVSGPAVRDPVLTRAQPELGRLGVASPQPLRTLFDSDVAWTLPQATTTTSTQISLSSLEPFQYRLGDPPPPPQDLKISTNGTGGTYILSVFSSGWLRTNRIQGEPPDTVQVTVSPSPNLQPGRYSGSIEASLFPLTPAKVNVFLDVTPATPPNLALAQQTLRFNFTRGESAPANRTVRVESSGQPLDFTTAAVSAGNWLSVDPASGKTPADLSIGVDPTNLSPGSYTGEIRVFSPGAPNSPQSFQVVLQVSAGTLPAIRGNGVLNGAALTDTIAPGSWVTILGENLATIPDPGRGWGPDDVVDGAL